VRGRREIETAATLLAAAKTTGVTEDDVVTALPHAFYPESSWRDDLELGYAELALAANGYGDARATMWRDAALSFVEPAQDTLNLYDVGTLAHLELARLVSEPALLADVRRRLDRARRRAQRDPFRAAVTYDDFDAAPHAF